MRKYNFIWIMILLITACTGDEEKAVDVKPVGSKLIIRPASTHGRNSNNGRRGSGFWRDNYDQGRFDSSREFVRGVLDAVRVCGCV